jgi:hypothetical protein
MLEKFLLLTSTLILAGCSIQRAVVAQGAQEKMVGMSREQVLACMGPPANKAAEGVTEVWSYGSGNGQTTAIGSVYARTDGSFTGERRGNQFTGNGTATTTGLVTATSMGRHCTVNVAMTNGIVSRVNYSGPTGGILTAGEQCAFAIQNCVQ